jgi:hypothetical protein
VVVDKLEKIILGLVPVNESNFIARLDCFVFGVVITKKAT